MIAQQNGSPVLFHCTAGKDRTGWLAALVLSALEVEREAIITDYLLTNERFTTGRGAIGRRTLLASLSEHVSLTSAWSHPLLEARVEYLSAAFDAAEEIYGTVAAFLSEGLGADVNQLRECLVEPQANPLVEAPAPASREASPSSWLATQAVSLPERAL